MIACVFASAPHGGHVTERMSDCPLEYIACAFVSPLARVIKTCSVELRTHMHSLRAVEAYCPRHLRAERAEPWHSTGVLTCMCGDANVDGVSIFPSIVTRAIKGVADFCKLDLG